MTCWKVRSGYSLLQRLRKKTVVTEIVTVVVRLKWTLCTDHLRDILYQSDKGKDV